MWNGTYLFFPLPPLMVVGVSFHHANISSFLRSCFKDKKEYVLKYYSLVHDIIFQICWFKCYFFRWLKVQGLLCHENCRYKIDSDASPFSIFFRFVTSTCNLCLQLSVNKTFLTVTKALAKASHFDTMEIRAEKKIRAIVYKSIKITSTITFQKCQPNRNSCQPHKCLIYELVS